MARPKKHNCDYFSHDNNMRNDPKLKAVRAKFGIEGYAIYNMILETLTEQDCIVYKWESLEIEMMAGDFGIASEKLIEMVQYFVKIHLLKITKNLLYCPQLDKRLQYVFDKRNQFLTQIRTENRVSVTETIVSVTESTRSEVKGREVKGKEKDKILQQPKNVVEALSPQDFHIFNSIKNNQFFDDYDSDVCDLVNKYFELYETRTGKVHPSLVNEQMETVLDHIQECYEHYENGHRREVNDMMNDFFNRADIQTDYNINHFAAWVGGLAEVSD